MIYVKVTPNRPDALGVYGIARDLAAKGLGKLKPLAGRAGRRRFRVAHQGLARFPGWRHKTLPALRRALHPRREERPVARMAAAPAARPSACARSRRWWTSPTTSPSPMAGPLHVFDADKVKGNIRARLAKDGETLAALDGKTYTLTRRHDGDRRRCRSGGHRRHHRRRAIRAARTTPSTCSSKSAYFDPAAHGGHRPQARHHFRCALPLRARRRSGLHAGRRRDRHAHDPRPLRRRSLACRHGGCRARYGAAATPCARRG